MIRSLKEIPPVVSLPQPGGGRVEISVVDDVIWISDYAKDDKGNDVSNFTLCVARGPLEGAPDAAAGVHALFRRRGTSPSNLAAGTHAHSQAQRAMLARLAPAMVASPPSKAGYWFVDPTITPHGGPVVVVDP
jgi:hypothetical protein